MTINRVFVYVSAQRMSAMRSFYRNVLKPLGYTEMIRASDNDAVDEFHRLALTNDGADNGKPGIRQEMSRQLYYAAFVHDPEGNNLEAGCVDKTRVTTK